MTTYIFKPSKIVPISAGDRVAITHRTEIYKLEWLDNFALTDAPEAQIYAESCKERFRMVQKGERVNNFLYKRISLNANGRCSVYYHDKASIRTEVERECAVGQDGLYMRLFNLFRSGKLPAKSVVIMKDFSFTTTTYKQDIKAYAPVMGYWVGQPTMACEYVSLTSGGYSRYMLTLPFNMERSALCNQFVPRGTLYFSDCHYKYEPTGEVFRRIDECPYYYELSDTEHRVRVLCDLRSTTLKNKHGEWEEHCETTRIYPDKFFTDLRKERAEFKESLVMAVFHPERVDKMLTKYGNGEDGKPDWSMLV